MDSTYDENVNGQVEEDDGEISVVSDDELLDKQKNGNLKLLDFGLAKEIKFSTMSLNSTVGTRYYQAPELFLLLDTTGGKYNYKADLWSLGV